MTQEEIDKVLAGNAAYIQTKIPAGTYTGQDNDANTFGVKCLIIVTADMDAESRLRSVQGHERAH